MRDCLTLNGNGMSNDVIQLHHIGIIVKDIEKSIHIYENLNYVQLTPTPH